MLHTRLVRLVLLAVALGCSGDTVGLSVGPTGVSGGTGGTSSAGDLALLGSWRRTLVFSDAFGITRTSETTWTFASQGTAARIVVATNLVDGASDALVTLAHWRTQGRSVVIDFLAPDTGQATFEWRIERDVLGDILFLDATAFRRVVR